MALTEAQIESKLKALEIQFAQHSHTWVWKWWPRIEIENLKWQSDYKVKVSSTDASAWTLSEKLSEWAGVFFQTITDENDNQTLKINWELIFWWDWSDWDLVISSWETITLNASANVQIKNYTSIDIQSWGILNIQNTNTAPVVLKCSWNITITWSINFNSTYDNTSAFTAFLLWSGATFTPTWLKNTNKWWTDLIINCVWNFDWTSWSINLWATSPWVAWALRIITNWTYTAWTYTSSSTTVIENPIIF